MMGSDLKWAERQNFESIIMKSANYFHVDLLTTFVLRSNLKFSELRTCELLIREKNNGNSFNSENDICNGGAEITIEAQTIYLK